MTMSKPIRRNPIRSGDVLTVGVIAVLLYAASRFGRRWPPYNPASTAAIINPITGLSPSGLKPGDPGFTWNVPAGF